MFEPVSKRKNIRNHGFSINGIINHTVSVDVVTNDLYNIGVNDDQLNLIYECDSLSKVAVKTPVGLTKETGSQV